MKVVTVLSAAFLALTPVVASAQDASSTGRANGDKPVGPASENGDNTTSNTKNPGGSGRSAYPDPARPGVPSGTGSSSMGSEAPSGETSH